MMSTAYAIGDRYLIAPFAKETFVLTKVCPPKAGL